MLLPRMRCDDDCGACCGPAPLSERERKIIKHHIAAHGIRPVDQGVTCPFYQGQRCAIYPARPRICQAYGHSELLPCERGYNTNVDELRLRAWLLEDGPPVGTTHDFLGGANAATALAKVLLRL